MLMSHGDVLLADAEALGTASNGTPTWESGIFARNYSDDQILQRFENLYGQAPFILEKTPSHIFHIDRIKSLFEDAFFVITHREPYSCLLSWKVARRTFMRSNDDFGAACRKWSMATDTLIRHYDDPRVLPVDYHWFAKNTESASRAIFDFIGLDDKEIGRCLEKMNDPRLERVSGVVGESIRGGKTRLSAMERFKVFMICGRTERHWQRISDGSV
jgi:hypothetical protein